MGEAALLRRHRVPGDFLHRTMDRLALAVVQPVGAERDLADLAVFEKGHLARVIEQRGNVGSDECLAFAPADYNWRGIFRDDQAFRIAPVEKQQSVGAVDFLQRAPHRIEKIDAAHDFFRDQMSDDLGVGLGAEMSAAFGQLLLELEIVFDDAVVHDDDVAGAMRMGVALRRPAVGGPARVADAHRAGHRRAAQHRFQIAELAFAAADRHLAVAENRDAGGVVAAVFELAQAFQYKRRCFPLPDISDDAAHYFLFPFILARFCSVQPSRIFSSRWLNTSAPAGTSWRTVLAVATYTSSPNAIGATQVVSLPTCTRSPLVVLYLLKPS